jgi:hypothetical protein
MRRRDLLKKGAVAGATLWVAPAIESVANRAAAASGAPTTIFVYQGPSAQNPLESFYLSVVVTGQNAGHCVVASPPANTCASCQAIPIYQVIATCQAINVNVNNYVVDVGIALGILGQPTTSGSFMVCNGKCYRPTGSSGNLVFNCASPGASC